MVIVHFLMRMAGDRIVPKHVLIFFVVLCFLLPLVQQKEINSRQRQLSDADMHRGVRSAGRIPVNYWLSSFSDPTFFLSLWVLAMAKCQGSEIFLPAPMCLSC